MSEDRDVGRWIALARQHLSRGATTNAIDALKRALGSDPEHAEAHALLALALLDARRLHTAELEAGLAMSSDPDLPLAQQAMGFIAMAKRRFDEAEACLDRFRAMVPESPEPYRALAQVYQLTERLERAREFLDHAIGLDPDDADTLVALGRLDLASGEIAEAERRARDALTAQPEHQEALVLMGHVALRRNDIEAAREHCVWALRVDATDENAIGLLTAIKAQTSWFLGAWWKFVTWIGSFGDARSIAILLGGFLFYRFATQVLVDLGQPAAARAVRVGWLALCVYTWIAPTFFERALKRELAPVALSKDF